MELKTKFNIGDTIFCMAGSLPMKSTICGITSFSGKQRDANGRIRNTDAGKCLTTYHIESCGIDIIEEQAFATKEELIKSLFDTL